MRCGLSGGAATLPTGSTSDGRRKSRTCELVTLKLEVPHVLELADALGDGTCTS